MEESVNLPSFPEHRMMVTPEGIICVDRECPCTAKDGGLKSLTILPTGSIVTFPEMRMAIATHRIQQTEKVKEYDRATAGTDNISPAHPTDRCGPECDHWSDR